MTGNATNSSGQASYPGWLPENARTYLDHVGRGASLREIARVKGCHPSTIGRRVRAVEARRDDPLVDEALNALQASCVSNSETINQFKEQIPMTAPLRPPPGFRRYHRPPGSPPYPAQAV